MNRSAPGDREATAAVAATGRARLPAAAAELFESAFRYAPIAMALVGLDGRFLRINGAFCSLVDLPEAELLATDFQTITHPDDLDADLEQWARLRAGEIDSYAMEKRYVRRDGALVWVDLHVSMVRDDQGAPEHFIAQVQDLTARREVEGRYRLLAENCTDVIVTTGLDGRITFISPAVTGLTGWSPAELLGQRPLDYAHPDERASMREVFLRVAGGEHGLQVRWRGRRKDGDWVWIESNPTMLVDGSPSGAPEFLDVMRDCSAQVAQEAVLARAMVAAEAAAEAKANFLANMSHEIRTPLTAVIGFSGLLTAQPELAARSRHFAERIAAAGRSLLSIVNDILDFSKLEAGAYEIFLGSAAPAEVARETVALFRGQAEAKGLALTLECDPGTEAPRLVDADRLGQVMTNLVGNAVKFTEAGEVRLAVTASQGRLDVSVADTGAGLDADQLTKLFQRFSQVDGSATRRHGGTGLGLAICRGLVEAMGGRIDVRSEPGAGSTFHFWIPAPAASDGRSPHA